MMFFSLKSADDVSYKSHRGRGSKFAGCMEDTRVMGRLCHPNVCSLGGMAGIGKSSVAVTFSERMDKKLKLGASFFCSDSCRDARLIVPTIARMLGRISPRTRSAICERSRPTAAVSRSHAWTAQFESGTWRLRRLSVC
ncbi:hypothetical protein JB92DRAFT_657412 [Gautieria morchelliformis]|nr:hypothetical protein JB92DRAFT_657412 [Gautieria morchelliformis]